MSKPNMNRRAWYVASGLTAAALLGIGVILSRSGERSLENKVGAPVTAVRQSHPNYSKVEPSINDEYPASTLDQLVNLGLISNNVRKTNEVNEIIEKKLHGLQTSFFDLTKPLSSLNPSNFNIESFGEKGSVSYTNNVNLEVDNNGITSNFYVGNIIIRKTNVSYEVDCNEIIMDDKRWTQTTKPTGQTVTTVTPPFVAVYRSESIPPTVTNNQGVVSYIIPDEKHPILYYKSRTLYVMPSSGNNLLEVIPEINCAAKESENNSDVYHNLENFSGPATTAIIAVGDFIPDEYIEKH